MTLPRKSLISLPTIIAHLAAYDALICVATIAILKNDLNIQTMA